MKSKPYSKIREIAAENRKKTIRYKGVPLTTSKTSLVDWAMQLETELQATARMLDSANEHLSQYIRFIELLKTQFPTAYTDTMTLFAREIEKKYESKESIPT